MTVAELERRMSAQEYDEWLHFYTREPWGFEVESWRVALLAATIANTARDPKRRRKPFLPQDFLPRVRVQRRRRDWREIKNAALWWTHVLGGKVIRNDDA